MLIRHCANCGREIQVSLPYSAKYVYYQKKWYCADCFTVITTPRILNNGWFEKTKVYATQEVSKDNIDRLFKKHYNVSLIPQYIYVKLDSIYKGAYKGQAEPISPYELYDILLRKMDYLDKNAAKKSLTGIPRINYDLAVAIGSYKSYKEWKASVIAEQTQEEQLVQERQSYSYKLKGYVPSSEPEPDDNIIPFDDEDYDNI